MDRETIIRLAQEAGLVYCAMDGWTSPTPENKYPEGVEQEPLERFAALVVANNPPQSWMSYQEGYEAGQQAGRLAEREECAKILDGAPRLVPSLQFPGGHCFVCGLNSEKIAEAIRSRTCP